MTIGYDKPLYVLPFDHRATFSKNMFGWQEPLTTEQTAEIAGAKQVIYDAFKAGGVPKDRAGILVDEEYGINFARHIEASHLTFCKVLVRYNPGDDKALNRRQASRLRRLSDYLHAIGTLYMFELLVPPDPAQLQRLSNDRRAYDLQLRPALMVQAIHELQDAGVEADVWKIEGIDRREDCERGVAAARRAGRHQVGCIVLGRGEDDRHVRQWLTTAAAVPGFTGFAVGRTTFWDPLVNYRAQKITREAAVAQIAASYRAWAELFEKAK